MTGMTASGRIRDPLLAALEKHGPMASDEIATKLGWSGRRVIDCITRYRTRYPGTMFRISGYQHRLDSAQHRPRPVYSAEGGTDMTIAEWRKANPLVPRPNLPRRVEPRVVPPCHPVPHRVPQGGLWSQLAAYA